MADQVVVILGTLVLGAVVLFALFGMSPAAKTRSAKSGLQPKEGWHKH